MKKNFKNFSILFIVTLLSSIFFMGCDSSEKRTIDENTPRSEQGLKTDQPNDLTGDRNINKGEINNSDPNIIDDKDLDDRDINDRDIDDNDIDDNAMIERSRNLATKLSDLDKVNSANVLITGNTALVGVDIAKDSNDETTKQIKNTVENRVKELDKQIDNVVVTADADLITRIKNVGTDIESGKPISGLGKEIEEIIKRITPNM